jgi:5-methylcytosine-specific restriction endonuclease McrA
MLKVERRAAFRQERSGLLRRRVWRFFLGDQEWTDVVYLQTVDGRSVMPSDGLFGRRSPIDQVVARQAEQPIKFLSLELPSGRIRSYWAYCQEVYYCDEELDDADVATLVLERELRKRRRIERARSFVATGLAGAPARQPIPDEVKLFVWQRDGGACIQCGSNRNLEYDHVIPLALGGSNTARNLQLLCADCNRLKGGSLTG